MTLGRHSEVEGEINYSYVRGVLVRLRCCINSGAIVALFTTCRAYAYLFCGTRFDKKLLENGRLKS